MRVYICDISAGYGVRTDQMLARLSTRWRDTVPAAGSEQLHRQRVAVRTVLQQLLGDDVTLQSTPKGAPCLSDGRAISISHDGDLCVIALGEAGEHIGIDVQCHGLPEEKTTALAARFFKHLQSTRPLPEEQYLLFSVTIGAQNDNSCVQIQQYMATADAKSADRSAAFYADWTRLEALLKSAGEGFGAIGELPTLCARCATRTLPLADSTARRYTLTLACEMYVN